MTDRRERMSRAQIWRSRASDPYVSAEYAEDLRLGALIIQHGADVRAEAAPGVLSPAGVVAACLARGESAKESHGKT